MGHTCSSKLLASLFGLAPDGVCRATECYHRRGALLPHPFTLTTPHLAVRSSAVCFLLHFPWAHAPQALPGVLPWEPGLSSTLARSDCLANSAADGGDSQRDKQGKRKGRLWTVGCSQNRTREGRLETRVVLFFRTYSLQPWLLRQRCGQVVQLTAFGARQLGSELRGLRRR